MVDWDVDTAVAGMRPGDSFFVPTLNPKADMRSIYAAAKRFGAVVTCKEAIKEGVLGVRTWKLSDVDKLED
jgi:hypothetical protein